MPHRFDPTILREYDVRGIVGETLFPADAHGLGRAFAATLANADGKRAAVGYDGRLSSPEFAAATLGVDGGVMVTGSHNPPDHNGFKLVLGGKPFFGEAIQKLGKTALALGPPAGLRGKIAERRVFDD